MTRIAEAKALGRYIRAVRKALGLTQDKVALASGANRRFIIELENGKATAQIGKALQVLRSLGIGLEVTPPAGVKLTDKAIDNGEPDNGPAT